MNKLVLIVLILISQLSIATDRTSDYLLNKEFSINAEIAKNYKVLIVPGVLAETFDNYSHQPVKLGIAFEQGFADQIKTLQTSKIEFEYLNFDTESSPEKNGKIIAKAILNSKKKVLIYSHSKGGLDTLEAIKQNPKILKNIQGWASVQTPFYGSAVAEYFNNKSILKKFTEDTFQFFGGSKGGFHSLTLKERTSYMSSSEIQALINKINKEIKFLNYASSKADLEGTDSSIEILRDYSLKFSGENDGVVAVDSGLLARNGFDIDFILEENVDHLMTMAKYKLLNKFINPNLIDFNREKHTIAILNTLMEQ